MVHDSNQNIENPITILYNDAIMSKEVLQSSPRKDSAGKRIIPKAIRSAVLVGGISLALTAGSYDSGNDFQVKYENEIVSSVDMLSPTATKEALTQDIFIASSKPKQEQEIKSGDEKISDFLKDNYARAGLAATIAAAIATTALAYYLGKRHDEMRLRILRITGPLLFFSGVSTTFAKSFTTIIDINIPASLLAGSVLLAASYQTVNAFQRYKDPKIRALALFGGTALTSLGAIGLLALNK